MFKEKFKVDLEQIKVSSQTKAKVLNKMERAVLSQPITQKIKRLKLTAALAAMVAICLVAVSFFEVYNKTPSVFTQYQPTVTLNTEPVVKVEGLNKADSYDEIYALFEQKYEDEYEIAYEDGETEEKTAQSDGPPQQESASVDFGGNASSKGEVNFSVGTTTNSNSAKQNSNTVTTPETEFSETNTQVEGIDESDIVKTDGSYIYILKPTVDKVVIAKPQNGKILNTVSFKLEQKHINGHYITYDEMYVNSGMLTVIGSTYTTNGIPRTVVAIYSLENPEEPKHINTLSQTGSAVSTRISNGVLYMLSTQDYTAFTANKENPKTYLPFISTKDNEQPIKVDDIYLFTTEQENSQTYLVACSIKIKTAEFISAKAVLGGGEEIFASEKSIYAVRKISNSNDNDYSSVYNTKIVRFEISDSGSILPVAVGEVKGSILNQFSMAESTDGYFRIVTTVQKRKSTTKYNNLYILNAKLQLTGSIENLAPNEKIYSARLSGDIGYFVTYREVDPLFAVDLTNPEKPKILSKLKIPGFSEYLHPFGNGLLLGIGKDSNDRGLIKLSMFNVSDPKNVTEKHTTILSETVASVSENHKAALISVSKNIIGFGVGYNGKYYVFSYSAKNGFIKEGVLSAPSDNCAENRGIYIGDYLYICSSRGIKSYSLKTFKQVATVDFNS